MIRIIARRVPWPDAKAQPNRSGLRLRWDALTEDGELLAAATEWPLCDGAAVLCRRGAAPDAMVTLRHEGSPHDAFRPMPLRVPAAKGAKRAEKRAQAATLSQRTAVDWPEVA